MTRIEYIQTLRKELRKLPPEEIVAATEFFEEYFDEALDALDTEGLSQEAAQQLREETMARLIEEAGSPRTVARQIRAEYASRILEGESAPDGKKATVGSRISAIWWVIIGICSAPVSIPIAICIGCLAFGVILFVLSVMCGVYAGIIGIAAGAIGSLVLGCLAIPAAGSTAVMSLGTGLVLAAVSSAAGVGAFIGTRELIRWLARLARRVNEKRKMKKTRRMTGGAGYENA